MFVCLPSLTFLITLPCLQEEIEQLLSPRRSKEAAEEAKRLYEQADSNKVTDTTILY